MKSTPIIFPLFAALFVAAIASAQPGIGISKDSTMTGAGTIASPLGVNTSNIQRRVSSSCSAGNAIRVVNQDGTVTCESTAGGGWSAVGGVSSTTNQALVGTGGITSFRRMQINGSLATDEEMLWIQDTTPNHVGTIANQAIALVLRQMGSSDATATTATATGADIAVTQTRSAGSNALTNIAVLANASGGTVNHAWFSTNGDMVQTGDAHFGNADMSGTLSVTGTTTLGNVNMTGLLTAGTSPAGSTHIINGSMRVRSNAADTFINLQNTSTGGRNWFIEASGNSGTDPNCIAIYDNTAGATRFKITSTGEVVATIALGVGASRWRVGTGSPNGVVTGSPGDLYTNSSGGASTTLYVKESGAATNTGWVAK